MNGTARFFLNELSSIRRNCWHIRRGLTGDDLSDPVHAGEIEQLEIELGHYAQVVGLLEYTGTPAEALAAIRRRYLRAQVAHRRCWQARRTADCDQWWITLGQVQYLSALYERLRAWLADQPPRELRHEDGDPVPVRALLRACEQLNIFAVQAKAQLYAARHADLVRDDPEVSDPRGRP